MPGIILAPQPDYEQTEVVMSLVNMMIFTGNANPRLAMDIAGCLNLPLGKINVGCFSDGEVMVDIGDNVRGHDIYILQSICAPANDNLMELLVMTDAIRRASGRRQSAGGRKGLARGTFVPAGVATEPITAKVVA